MIRFQTESNKGEIGMDYQIVSIRDNPEYLDMGIKYFTKNWGYEKIYQTFDKLYNPHFKSIKMTYNRCCKGLINLVFLHRCG